MKTTRQEHVQNRQVELPVDFLDDTMPQEGRISAHHCATEPGENRGGLAVHNTGAAGADTRAMNCHGA